MADCNATLTTATVSCGEDDCGSVYHHEVHVELHTLTCVDSGCGIRHRNDINGKTSWRDDTPGATPHTPVSTVTDAEVEAALDVLVRNYQPVHNSTVVSLREALEAAAAVRAAQEDDR